MRLCFLILMLGCCCGMMICACGCSENIAAGDYRDEAAVDMAVSTMVETPDPVPTPGKCERCGGSGWITHGDGHRTPCPECHGSSGNEYSGPIDTIRDAKELIRKANRAVDRGNAILDAVERDGKVSVDIRLPAGTAVGSKDKAFWELEKSCDNASGFCRLLADLKNPGDKPQGSCDICPNFGAQSDVENNSYRSCQEGIFRRPRLFWRWQR